MEYLKAELSKVYGNRIAWFGSKKSDQWSGCESGGFKVTSKFMFDDIPLTLIQSCGYNPYSASQSFILHKDKDKLFSADSHSKFMEQFQIFVKGLRRNKLRKLVFVLEETIQDKDGVSLIVGGELYCNQTLVGHTYDDLDEIMENIKLYIGNELKGEEFTLTIQSPNQVHKNAAIKWHRRK